MTRIERCRALGVLHTDLVGGEPLVHQDLERLFRQFGASGMTRGMITDGLLLTVARVDSLVDAGLKRLQITMAGTRPAREMPRSLKTLKERIGLCADLPIGFAVNAVLCDGTLDDVEEVARFCFELGVGVNVSVIQDKSRLRPPNDEGYLGMICWLRAQKQVGQPVVTSYYLLDYYERTLTGAPPDWSCRAGQKCFYVAADGASVTAHRSQRRVRSPASARTIWRDSEGPRAANETVASTRSFIPPCTFSNVRMVMASDLGGRIGAAKAGARLRLPVLTGAG